MCITDHVTGLDLLLKGLGLVQGPWEAVNQEAAAATGQHCLLQQCNCDLQNSQHSVGGSVNTAGVSVQGGFGGSIGLCVAQHVDLQTRQQSCIKLCLLCTFACHLLQGYYGSWPLQTSLITDYCKALPMQVSCIALCTAQLQLPKPACTTH